MLSIEYLLQDQWPKLTWVCVLACSTNSARLFHGPLVEVSDNWAVEAVWDGDFAQGGFDKTDLVFGSGVRKRGSKLCFVTAATGIDRLWHCCLDGNLYVSNSLPALLSATKLNLDTTYFHYAADISTVETKGVFGYKETIPSAEGQEIHVTYFQNLVWDGLNLKKIDKPDLVPDFSGYASYENYLLGAAQRMGENARSANRANKVEIISGLSTGYDSVATTIVAQSAGCKNTVSIENSSSLWRGADSGSKIATFLGVECQTYRQAPNKYKFEIAVWAGSGGSGGRNLSLFNYPEPLSMFFSGGFGDSLWERQLRGSFLPVGDYDEMMCEFRLLTGLFMTQVPWWGIRKASDIRKISQLDEMKPWTLGTNYDRPIARRMAEEAGVPRELFGIRKKNTASNTPFWWPSTKEGHDSFNLFLQNIGMRPYSKWKVWILKKFYKALRLFNGNALFFIDGKRKWKPWLNSPVRPLLFIWANTALKEKYYKNEDFMCD